MIPCTRGVCVKRCTPDRRRPVSIKARQKINKKLVTTTDVLHIFQQHEDEWRSPAVHNILLH